MPRIRAASIDEHKALVRADLIASAKMLIAESGTAEIPLGEIALAAGVGRTTLYDYFSDRDDLIATIVEIELPQVIEELIDSVPSHDSASARLAALAVKMVEFVVSDPVLGLILHRDVGLLGSDAQQRIRLSHAELSEEMVRTYHQGVESGELRPMPPDLAGRLIQDVIMSAAKTVISSSHPTQRLDEITSNLRVFLLGGLSV